MNKKVVVIPRSFYQRKPHKQYFSFGSLATLIPDNVREVVIKKERSSRFQKDFDLAMAERGRRAKAVFFDGEGR